MASAPFTKSLPILETICVASPFGHRYRSIYDLLVPIYLGISTLTSMSANTTTIKLDLHDFMSALEWWRLQLPVSVNTSFFASCADIWERKNTADWRIITRIFRCNGNTIAKIKSTAIVTEMVIAARSWNELEKLKFKLRWHKIMWGAAVIADWSFNFQARFTNGRARYLSGEHKMSKIGQDLWKRQGVKPESDNHHYKWHLATASCPLW